MKLYYSEISNYCAKVKFLIDLKKIQISLISPPGGYGSKEFKKISPQGVIPTLSHNKIVLSESEIINEYLNDLYPKPAMLTKNIEVNAKIKEISRFHDFKLEPSIRFFFKFKKKINIDNDEILNGFKNVNKNLLILEELISNKKYIATDNITLADCAFPSWFALFDIFSKHFNYKIILKDKTKKYYENLIRDQFMSYQYKSYYQNALKWSKENFPQLRNSLK